MLLPGKACAKAEQELDVWEWKCATLRLSGPSSGQMLTTETTKFSSFRPSEARAEGAKLLLWGQVKVVQIARPADSHLSQT